MKKIFVSMGLMAAGTVGLQAAYAPNLTPIEANKLWSLSATLRAFYDDNYTTGPGGHGSAGFEISPEFELNKPMQQTEISLRYIYGLYYYQERENLGQNPIDQTHEFDLWVDHAFTERFQAKVTDSFIVGQEPWLLSNGETTADPDRVEGNNIANYATITAHYDLTKLLSTDLGYENGFIDYQQRGGNAVNPSLSGLLDRDENTAWLNLNWLVRPETTALVGVRYEQVNYLGNEQIALVSVPPFIYYSNNRDNHSYTGYLGVQEKFLPNLVFAANVGAQYTDDYNDPLHETSLSPYAVASLTYTYARGDYMQIGVTHERNATDEVAPVASNGSIALDQESTLVYGNINHYLTAKLLATLIGQVQFSSFNGGIYNNSSDTLYSLGLNFNYIFTPHFSADAGYNFDDLQSKISGRGFSRNRVYIGISARY